MQTDRQELTIYKFQIDSEHILDDLPEDLVHPEHSQIHDVPVDFRESVVTPAPFEIPQDPAHRHLIRRVKERDQLPIDLQEFIRTLTTPQQLQEITVVNILR